MSEILTQEPVSTDDEEVRSSLRTETQFNLYGLNPTGYTGLELKNTFGKSAVERFLDLRNALFPENLFPRIDSGANPRQLTSRISESYDVGYPPATDVAGILLPSLFKLIDEVYEDILNIIDTELKNESVLRLASVLFTLGITIHPASNGNGQTFKMMILSYLHELHSVYNNSYIPIKFSNNRLIHTPAYEINTMFTRSFSESQIREPIITKNENDRLLLEMFTGIRDLYRDYRKNLNNEKEFNFGLDNPELLNIVRNCITMPEFTCIRDILEGGKNQEITRIYHILRFHLSDIFFRKNYDSLSVKSFFNLEFNKVERTTYALLTLLNSNENMGIIKNYVLNVNTNPNFVKTDIEAETIQMAIASFEEVKTDITRLLSNSNISSEEAIKTQMELAKRYRTIAKEIKKRKREDITFYVDYENLERLGIERDAKNQADWIGVLEDSLNNTKNTPAINMPKLIGWFKKFFYRD